MTGAINTSGTKMSAKGTRNNSTTGTATKLTSGEMSDTCWKKSNINGDSPMDTLNCISTPACQFDLDFNRPSTRYIISTTAKKDSQNPMESKASGLRIKIPSIASAKLWRWLICR